jgi:hypothetical protein
MENEKGKEYRRKKKMIIHQMMEFVFQLLFIILRQGKANGQLYPYGHSENITPVMEILIVFSRILLKIKTYQNF